MIAALSSFPTVGAPVFIICVRVYGALQSSYANIYLCIWWLFKNRLLLLCNYIFCDSLSILWILHSLVIWMFSKGFYLILFYYYFDVWWVPILCLKAPKSLASSLCQIKSFQVYIVIALKKVSIRFGRKKQAIGVFTRSLALKNG